MNAVPPTRVRILALLVVGLALGAAAPRPTLAADPRLATGATFRDCPDCPQMVVVPAGSVVQGMDGGEPERYEGPPHTVTIRYRFAVGRTEITTGQFRAFVEATGYQAGGNCNIWDGHTAFPTPGADWRNPGYGRPAADEEPVACVSWNDAMAYVAWITRKTDRPYRLLSESEWEYAARGGVAGTFAWGDDPNQACKTANVADLSTRDLKPPFIRRPFTPAQCDDGYPAIAPAGVLQPNGFGLYDMTGSVWEWVQDCYVMPYPPNTPIDGRPWLGPEGCDRRVSKGGSWGTSIDRQRPSFRGRDPATLVSQVFGFRIARDLAP